VKNYRIYIYLSDYVLLIFMAYVFKPEQGDKKYGFITNRIKSKNKKVEK